MLKFLPEFAQRKFIGHVRWAARVGGEAGTPQPRLSRGKIFARCRIRERLGEGGGQGGKRSRDSRQRPRGQSNPEGKKNNNNNNKSPAPKFGISKLLHDRHDYIL